MPSTFRVVTSWRHLFNLNHPQGFSWPSKVRAVLWRSLLMILRPPSTSSGLPPSTTLTLNMIDDKKRLGFSPAG